jgi:hypothetical protein
MFNQSTNWKTFCRKGLSERNTTSLKINLSQMVKEFRGSISDL